MRTTKKCCLFKEYFRIVCFVCIQVPIGRLKAQMVNAYYAQRIIDVFEKTPNTTLNKESINEIFSFDADAA